MPSSNLVVAPLVLNHLWLHKPESVLDIGPGHGKYAVLVREYVNPDARMVAIEAIEDYIIDFGLAGLYDDIHITDVMLAPEDLLNSCDVVLMADIIEHLEKRDALALLERIHVPVVISTPRDFFHNPPTHWSEVHRSHWTRKDFDGTGRVTRFDEYVGGLIVTLGPA